ncbi:hypothetical protein [Hyalangium rubrum]|uniref:Lipoprotein n=1 Tax=Hyalangium rubrum TaxID=3103134 RepID=A0ABU5HDP1_9BACT|nr:hypothetical protein [Hyalangium sp. s54d21]MDY7231390.1 hypothetical protein [Hyalangium sp. s54d21]
MSEQGYPVTVAVRRPDGRVEQVRVGTAYKSGDGFTLSMGELSIGGTPEAAPAPAARRAASGASASSGGGGGGGGGGEVFPNYGRSKGGPIRGATMQDLEYYANGARRSLGDPSKSRWHDKERALLASIEAEIARQRGGGGGGGGEEDYGGGGGGSGGMGDNEPPPHSDDDNIPF